MMSDSIFKYNHLDKSKRMIRLIRLSEDQKGAEVCLDICTVDLDSRPEYTALSYTWGPISPVREIRLNGQSFMVRENLFEFLVQLRAKSCEDWIWIDQICINQGEIKERNHQVSQMTDVYWNAARTIVWLGSARPETLFAFRCMTRDLDQLQGHDMDIAELESIGYDAFFAHEYWTRIWIVQELILSHEIDFWWRDLGAALHQVKDFVQGSNKSKHRNPAFVYVQLGGANHLKNAQKNGRRAHLITDLVETFHDSQCQDIKDRVYGFRGLLHPRIREILVVDYSMSVADLFRNGVHAMAEEVRLCPTSSGEHAAELIVLRFDGNYYITLANVSALLTVFRPRVKVQFPVLSHFDHRSGKDEVFAGLLRDIGDFIAERWGLRDEELEAEIDEFARTTLLAAFPL